MSVVIPEGPGFRPLLEIVDQPSDCTDHCPCSVGPSDLSEDGMHWTARPEVRAWPNQSSQ